MSTLVSEAGSLPILKTPTGREVIFQVAPSSRPPVSTGRNGDINTAGLVLDAFGTNLLISPITSKNKVGRAAVALPYDRAHLVALRDALSGMIDEMP